MAENGELFETEALNAAPLERLHLEFDAWEGPLDLLLTLARAQKVDLAQISILALTDQYLAYLDDAAARAIEVAADHLVMAAWLAQLKSALLLPREEQPDPDPEEIAGELRHRLARLSAMRDAGARLMARDRLGRDTFARGAPEGLAVIRNRVWEASLLDLIRALGDIEEHRRPVLHQVKHRDVVTLEDALERLRRLLPKLADWTPLERTVEPAGSAQRRRSARASGLVAALELARMGRVALRQEEAFAPLLLRGAR